MMIAIIIIANNYLIVPYANAFFGVGIQLDLPDALWTLLTIGVGGYTLGRSSEKIADKLKKPKPENNMPKHYGKTKSKR